MARLFAKRKVKRVDVLPLGLPRLRLGELVRSLGHRIGQRDEVKALAFPNAAVHPVERKQLAQWFLRITAYAERLLNDLDSLDWSDSMKEMQRHWIGKSEGARLTFRVKDAEQSFEVFTTAPDTIFGVTFMVLAPESELVPGLTTQTQKADVEAYVITGQKPQRYLFRVL